MKNSLALILLFLGPFSSVFSQSNQVLLSITPVYGDQLLSLVDSAFHTHDPNHLRIDALKFYISNIQFFKSGRVVFKGNNSFHLIDAAQPYSETISVTGSKDIRFDEVRFSIGIDSATNTAGVLGGDLDPTKGMYWTWQSGYINFKLEGTSTVCNTKNNAFTFHLGGYQHPFNAMQTVALPIRNSHQIQVYFDVNDILKQIDLRHMSHIMSPCADAVMLSKIVASSFKLRNNEK